MPGSITAAPAYALHQTLPRIDELAATVLDVHRERHPDLAVLRSAVLELRADLEPHLMKEELVLFPARREVGIATGPVHLPFGSVRNPVGMLMREHDTTGVMLSGLQAHLAEHPLPDGACASYTTLYRALASRPGRDVDQRVLRKTVLVAVDHEPAGTMEDHEENVDLTVHVLGDRLTRVQPDDVDIQVRRFGRGPVHPIAAGSGNDRSEVHHGRTSGWMRTHVNRRPSQDASGVGSNRVGDHGRRARRRQLARRSALRVLSRDQGGLHTPCPGQRPPSTRTGTS